MPDYVGLSGHKTLLCLVLDHQLFTVNLSPLSRSAVWSGDSLIVTLYDHQSVSVIQCWHYNKQLTVASQPVQRAFLLPVVDWRVGGQIKGSAFTVKNTIPLVLDMLCVDGWMIHVLWPFQHHRSYLTRVPMKGNERNG